MVIKQLTIGEVNEVLSSGFFICLSCSNNTPVGEYRPPIHAWSGSKEFLCGSSQH